MELFVTLIYNWKDLITVAKSSILDKYEAGCWYSKYDFTITVETVWIELDGFFVKQKLILPNRAPCQHLRYNPL